MKGQVDVAGIAGALGKRAVKRLRSLAIRLGGRIPSIDAMGRNAETNGSLRRWFAKLNQQRSRVLFVFSSHDAGLEDIDLHFGSPQGLTAMPGVSFAKVQNADHNFTPHWARTELFALVTEFVVEPKACI